MLITNGRSQFVSAEETGKRFVIRVFGEQWEVGTVAEALTITEGRWFRSNEDHTSIFDRVRDRFIRDSDLYITTEVPSVGDRVRQ